MAKKDHGHKKGESHVDESWLIPYADLLTLLLALFIVLFAASNIDKDKFQQIMQAFYYSFRPTISAGAGSDPISLGTTTSQMILPDLMIPPVPPPEPPDGKGKDQRRDEQLMALFNAINNYIDTNKLDKQISINQQGNSIHITLTSDVWFASGSADISKGHREIAKKLGDMIESSYSSYSGVSGKKDTPDGSGETVREMEIIITGHTDNLPISGTRFKSNWYLSAARALNFMEAMLENSHLEPRLFNARGYGEFEPISDNSTEEGRRINRRVEVRITLH